MPITFSYKKQHRILTKALQFIYLNNIYATLIVTPIMGQQALYKQLYGTKKEIRITLLKPDFC